jgi:outer membrane protein, heavy metal efflux system
MARRQFIALFIVSSGLLAVLSAGCSSTKQATISQRSLTPNVGSVAELAVAPDQSLDSPTEFDSELIQRAAHWDEAGNESEPFSSSAQGLAELEAVAAAVNPSVQSLEQQVQGAWARVGHVDRLPDPTIGTNVFGNPIETAAGSQRANLSVAQMIPWLERLDAKSQQACYVAMALQEALNAERLRVVADVRVAWFRLFVLGQQVKTNNANQQLLESLIQVAAARVATGAAAQGDVLLGTLELSRLEEQHISYLQQIESTKADLNRAVGREASHQIEIPESLSVSLPDWSYESLLQLAVEHQPAIEAARLNTSVTRWGVEVARLERRPNFAINAAWFAIDDNRPATSVVDVGEDAWSIGAQISLPVWREKYDAMENEANWKHQASFATVEGVTRRFDARIRDLWEQALAAEQTRQLYRETILPQARQTLEADQQSYANGAVEFDRVVRDVRNVLTLGDGLHRATGQLATALARIEEAVGTPIAGGVPAEAVMPESVE